MSKRRIVAESDGCNFSPAAQWNYCFPNGRTHENSLDLERCELRIWTETSDNRIRRIIPLGLFVVRGSIASEFQFTERSERRVIWKLVVSRQGLRDAALKFSFGKFSTNFRREPFALPSDFLLDETMGRYATEPKRSRGNLKALGNCKGSIGCRETILPACFTRGIFHRILWNDSFDSSTLGFTNNLFQKFNFN